MSMTDDIADYLDTLGVGVVGTNIFTDQMPETGGVTVMSISVSRGEETDKLVNIEFPNLQIRTRALDAEEAKQFLYLATNALHGIGDITIGADRYLYIATTMPPQYMGLDGNNRFHYVANFRVVKEYS